jgi:colanic acid/amylovoran biosynthesis glycosyltransferase
MRVAYLVSRFPSVSETFVVRELDAVAATGAVELELHSLFPAHREGVVHPAAVPWTERVQRPGVLEGVAALGRWLLERPLRTLGVIAEVTAGYASVPRVLPRALATIPLAAAHARRLRGVDHVHAHFATYPALAAWIVHRLAGTPYSFTAHAHDLFVHQAMLGRKAGDAAFVIAISEFNRSFVIGHSGRRRPDVQVVHCGVDQERFEFRVRAAGDPPRLACVAALRAPKGHSVLLAAMVGGREHLDLVGDGPLRASLEAEVERLGLADRVRFHGSLPEHAVADVLSRADAFVLPSVIAPDGDMEGIPVALMEALAAGLPAVATRHSGVPELIRDGHTGYLAEPGDVESLRAAIGRALTEPEPEARAAEGRALVEREFDQHRSARRLVELFGQAARRSAGSAKNGAISS